MITVVVPALNEAANIKTTLERLQLMRARGDEVVVVDGGSVDQTVMVASSLADRVIHADRGRARQMNAGAEAANGSILWFLHADTLVPEGADRLIVDALQDNVWGRFNVRFSGRGRLLSVVAWMMNHRSCWSGVATGDQGIFVTRTLFEQVGGYPLLPLMEDVALSKHLRRTASPFCVDIPLVTSSRRWEQRGTVRTIVLMWWLRFAYWIGVPVERIARWYR